MGRRPATRTSAPTSIPGSTPCLGTASASSRSRWTSGNPCWVDDEDFELEYHVRHTAVPSPGEYDQLQRLASRLLSQRVDLDRPLWEMWLVEGLAGGRWALINKAHHAMIDGLSGHDIMEVILDASPQGRSSGPSQWNPEPGPNTVGLMADALVDSVKRPGEHLGRILERATRPKELVEHVAVRTLGSKNFGQRMLATDTVLGGSNSPHRRWGWAETDLSVLKSRQERVRGDGQRCDPGRCHGRFQRAPLGSRCGHPTPGDPLDDPRLHAQTRRRQRG